MSYPTPDRPPHLGRNYVDWKEDVWYHERGEGTVTMRQRNPTNGSYLGTALRADIADHIVKAHNVLVTLETFLDLDSVDDVLEKVNLQRIEDAVYSGPRVKTPAEELKTLSERVQLLIDYLDDAGNLPDHCFTFPDGESWHATSPDPEPVNLQWDGPEEVCQHKQVLPAFGLFPFVGMTGICRDCRQDVRLAWTSA